MQPSDGFWEGVGQSVGTSPGWMVLGVVLIIGVLFVWAKYVHPDNKEIKLRELEVREREAQNDTERIKANAALAENMRGLRDSNDALAQQSAALAAGIEESKVRSRAMGADVTAAKENSDHIRETTDDTHDMVREIHAAVVPRGPEVTD